MDIRTTYKTTSSNTFEQSKTCREALASASLNISFNIVALVDSVRLETAVIYSPMVDFVLACMHNFTLLCTQEVFRAYYNSRSSVLYRTISAHDRPYCHMV